MTVEQEWNEYTVDGQRVWITVIGNYRLIVRANGKQFTAFVYDGPIKDIATILDIATVDAAKQSAIEAYQEATK